MKFITNETGNNFGDKIVTVLDSVTGKNIELFACEGEHSYLDRELKTLKVVRLSMVDKLDLISALGLLHLIKCTPVDVKLLKSELKAYSPKVVKIAKVVSELDDNIQDKILRFIC